jgi:hypothetical protein
MVAVGWLSVLSTRADALHTSALEYLCRELDVVDVEIGRDVAGDEFTAHRCPVWMMVPAGTGWWRVAVVPRSVTPV